MDERRVVALEEKLAHQELTVATLNEALVQQQERLDRLEALCARLAERLVSFRDEVVPGDPLDERPPHY